MSSSSFRPTYTKSRSTKAKTPRLHGAFRGGFSAGYFNTVGSKQGWKPGDEEGLPLLADKGRDDEDGQPQHVQSVPGDALNNSALQHSALRRKKRKMKPQTVHDFMDDEDANEWGGPVSVRKDYHDQFPETHPGQMNASKNIQQSVDTLRQIVSGDIDFGRKASSSIGRQLLRVLGWRETESRNLNMDGDATRTCYIYVPVEEGDTEQPLFPHKKIKRIERKLSKHKKALPKPKTDTYGLGYDAFRNAPEFQAHKDDRNRRAYKRARAASSIHGDLKQNVYRTSDLHGLFQYNGEEEDGDEGDQDGFTMLKQKRFGYGCHRKGPKSKPSCSEIDASTIDDDILAYETTEDFIGQKSVGGFALHDDDDDVYDDDTVDRIGKKNAINSEQYENEIVEASDSDDDDANRHGHAKQNANEVKRQQHFPSKHNIQSFAGALSSWASSGTEQGTKISSALSTKTVTTSIAVTSDGRQPLKGFALKSSAVGHETMKRFPGPDVPFNFVPKQHVFSNKHTSEMLKLLSSYMRKSNIYDEHHRSKHDEKNNMNFSQVRAAIKRDLKPLAGDSFLALSESLKDRFRKTSDETKGVGEKQSNHNVSPANPAKVTIVRKQKVWQPSPLLCKRMEVAVPRVSSSFPLNLEHGGQKERTTEESFFHQEIFGKIAKGTLAKQENDDTDFERPTLEIMKSIFEPPSNGHDDDDDDMSISDDDHDGDDDTFNVGRIENDSPKLSGTTLQETSHSQGSLQQEPSPFHPDMKPQSKRIRIPERFCAKDQASKIASVKEVSIRDEGCGSHEDDSKSSVSDNNSSQREHRRRHRKEKKYKKRKSIKKKKSKRSRR